MKAETPSSRWIAAVLSFAVAIVIWPLLLPWVYDTHDGHYAFYNAAQFDEALRDGQIPVRWLPDLFGGRGLPHFVYYHPLAFYLSSLLHATGVGFIASIKGVYIVGVLASGGAMWRWLVEYVPRRAALVGAVAYVLVPFHLVEIHVKGDPPAVLAFAFLPLLFLSIRHAATGTRWGVVTLALASAGLVLSHAVTALLALVPALGYALIELPRNRLRGVLRIGSGIVLGALTSAFYWLPALAERSLVLIDSTRGILFFDFHDHFVEVWQWFSPLWGYHGSFAGTPDDMAFQIGPIHTVGLLGGAWVWRSLERGSIRRLTGWAFIVTTFSLLATLEMTEPIWERIGPLRYVQFPWRFLVLVALGTSVLLAIASSRLRPKAVVAAASAAPAVITLGFAGFTGNRWYVAVGLFYALAGTFAWLLWRRLAVESTSVLCALLALTALPWSAVPLHSAWRGEPAIVAIREADLAPERVRLGIRRTTARDDYLPRSVKRIPPRDPEQEYRPPSNAQPPPDLVVLSGEPKVDDIRRTSDSFVFRYTSTSPTRVALNLHDFPGFRVRIRSTAADGWTARSHRADREGRIVLDLPEGENFVDVRFEKTAVRRLGDGLSLLGGIALLMVAIVVGARRPDGPASVWNA